MSKKQTKKKTKPVQPTIPDQISQQNRILWNSHEKWGETYHKYIKKEVDIFLQEDCYLSPLYEEIPDLLTLDKGEKIERNGDCVYIEHEGKHFEIDINDYWCFSETYLKLLFINELKKQWNNELMNNHDWTILSYEKYPQPKKDTVGKFDDLFN